MLDLFNIAKPQGCDIQTFYGLESPSGAGYYRNTRSWTKARGVSHVYMLLIGGGGNGDGATGGGSGAVTVWYGAAQHVPDILTLVIGGLGNQGDTGIYYRGTAVPSSTNFLLQAKGGTITSGGTAMTANQFSASGFFQSVPGRGGTSGSQSASSTTFLSGGSASGPVTAQYGYSQTAPSNAGFFMTQPMIVGCGGISDANGGIGCGSGGNVGALGGQGMILIASW
jgi:hypothetical protein